MPEARSLAKPGIKRHDIQGLRALAVLLVVANHTFGWPAGGFIGVDVFFVLSGFLMTSILYREVDSTGRIKFFAFYRRRIRRLIPAAATVIGATIAASYLLLGSGRFQSVLWDGLSALGFVSNWRFAIQQTDYFNQSAATSPLQHFWSLSVEEQFYLVWPLTLLTLFVLCYRSRFRRAAVTLIALAVTVLLFAAALSLTISDPGSAYFITPARLWELLLGGVIALSMPLFSRAGAWFRPLAMCIGFVGILVAAFVTPATSGFPAPWSALAVLSTALILAFPWQPRRFAALNPLTNPVSGYIGDISYSLYLWHFPAIILVTEGFRGLPGQGTPIPAIVAIVVSFVLAALSYRFVEEPVRKSSWLEPGKRRSATSIQRLRMVGLGALTIVSCLAVVAAFTVNRAGSAQAVDNTPSAGATAPETTTGQGGETGAAKTELQAKLSTALQATSWPQLDTDPGDPKGPQLDPRFDECSSFKYKRESCTFGDPAAPKTAVLVGDSIAAAYLPALAEVFGEGEWKLETAALYACPFIDLRLGDRAAAADACEKRRDAEVELVKSTNPDLVIVANTYLRNKTLDTGKSATLNEWQTAFDAQLTKLNGSYKSITVLPPPPYGASVETCYSPRTGPKECETKVSGSDYTRTMKMLSAVMEKHNGTVVQNQDWFCVKGRCPIFEGTTLIKFDAWHPSAAFVLDIVPVIREDFAALMAGAPAGGTPTETPETEEPTAETPTDELVE